ncbi:MAG: RHS repeat-associated core domain-containing protein, partial [Terracidiphilus sp.]
AGLHQQSTACNFTTTLGVSWRLSERTASGATVSYEYDAFGNGVSTSGSTPNNYLYRGEQYDPDLGLYYLRARYYNPLTGRFMSRDPNEGNLHRPATLHKYLYAGGDPINARDPSGRGSIQEYGLSLAILTTYVVQNQLNVIVAVGQEVCFPLELANLTLKWAQVENDGEEVLPWPIPDLIEQAHEFCESHIAD